MLTPFKQAVLILRWFLDNTRVAQPAVDNAIGKFTVYDYLDEGFEVLAAQAPSLQSALLAAKMAGHSHVSIDGTLIETDRVRTPGPTKGVDLWWSGKHANHGGNIQVVTAPDGWPLWTSDVRPGREHDTTALREHSEILPALNIWIAENLPALGDLGYEGESGTITVAFKKPKGGELTEEQKDHNKTHNGKRAVGERGNALLKTTFKALRNVSICPWRIGTIVAAALVILHSISVWRSVRASADTKTKRSRHTLAMPVRCVVAPHLHRIRQAKAKKLAGSRWQERGLVFASAVAPRWTRTTSAAPSAAAAGEAAAHHLDRFDRKPYLFIP